MNIIDHIRKGKQGVLVLGNHPAIVQSMLDFDYLCGKEAPSILGIVTGGRKAQKFFFGTKEILLPCFKTCANVPPALAPQMNFMLNVQSGRRVLEATTEFFAAFPQALGGTIFAENVPEKHSLELMKIYGKEKFISGPASVGILVPGMLKLGAIGGITPAQIAGSDLKSAGSIAVGSTSGGMTNELITSVIRAGKKISLAIAVGGDRFPVASLTDVFTLAEEDAQTKAFVYFGELGGVDEYEIIKLIQEKKFTKPIVAYIAGIIDEAFTEHVQFGHAKALVKGQDESARAKREALRAAGVIAPDTFSEFLAALDKLPGKSLSYEVMDSKPLEHRQKSVLSTREILDQNLITPFIKDGKLIERGENMFAASVMRALLGKNVSPLTSALVENIFELLIDHGGNVSGAVNTMITARAGKDLVSSLAAGLLTIGPRFGGAINTAAKLWLSAVSAGKTPLELVEEEAKAGRPIQGIGHRKYRVGIPDPRVEALSQFTGLLKNHPHYDFARGVEAITTGKNGTLILNVDGTIGALLLDVLSECEGYSSTDLAELIDAEFFNAMFVIPRSIGFIAHFIEQKKNDEGLFRLPDELLFTRKND